MEAALQGLALILGIEIIILFAGILIAQQIIKDVISKVDEMKHFADEKKEEIETFINEKQAFVEILEAKIRKSTLGTFLGL